MYRLIYIFLVVISLFVSISCTTEDNEYDEAMINWSSVFYPSSISNQYRVLFNGSELNYIPKGQNSGKLEVLSKTDDKVVLRIENATMFDNKFSFVKPLGDSIKLYDSEKYSTFKAHVIYTDGSSPIDWLLQFNKTPIQDNEIYYVSKAELSNAKLSLSPKKDALLLESINLKEGQNDITLFQTDNTFSIVPQNPEEPPQGCTKIRFFYTSKDLPGIERIKVSIFPTTNFKKWGEEISSIELKAGELSDYILIDWNKNLVGNEPAEALDYDVTDIANPNKKLIDHLGKKNWGLSRIYQNGNYKFVTGHIQSTVNKPAGQLTAESALSITW